MFFHRSPYFIRGVWIQQLDLSSRMDTAAHARLWLHDLCDGNNALCLHGRAGTGLLSRGSVRALA